SNIVAFAAREPASQRSRDPLACLCNELQKCARICFSRKSYADVALRAGTFRPVGCDTLSGGVSPKYFKTLARTAVHRSPCASTPTSDDQKQIEMKSARPRSR